MFAHGLADGVHDPELTCIQAVLGNAVDINLQISLVVDEHIQSFWAIQLKAIDILKHDADGIVLFV